MTDDEKLEIVNRVISAIRTNAKTIPQLTSVLTASDTDYIELSGGKKISYKSLFEAISADVNNNLGDVSGSTFSSVSGVAFTEDSGIPKLSITTAEQVVSANVPIASSFKSGFMTTTDKRNLSTAKATAKAAKDVTDTKGQAGGLAPLDATGHVSSKYIPDIFRDVRGYIANVNNVVVQGGSSATSTYPASHPRAAVVYDTTRKRFLLAVANKPTDGAWKTPLVEQIVDEGYGELEPSGPNKVVKPSTGDLQEFDHKDLDADLGELVESGNDNDNDDTYSAEDLWTFNSSGQLKLDVEKFTFYTNWKDASEYGTDSSTGRIPGSKLFVNVNNNTIYRQFNNELQPVGGRYTNGAGDEGFDTIIEVAPESITNQLPNDMPALKVNTNYGKIKALLFGSVIKLDAQGYFIPDIIDTGVYDSAKTYRKNAWNSDYTQYVTDDCWYKGCRWRCLYDGLAGVAPGYGVKVPNTVIQAWMFISGDPEFHADFEEQALVYNEGNLSNFGATLTIKARKYNQDVLDYISASNITWGRESYNANGTRRTASDAAWQPTTEYGNKRLVISGDDFNYDGTSISKIIFWARVKLDDEDEVTIGRIYTNSSVTQYNTYNSDLQ